MSTRRKKQTPKLSEQLSLLDIAPASEGSLDVSLVLKDVLSRAMRQCRLSRYQVAAQLSELTGRSVSKEMLDAYTAESKEGHRFPAELLPALCLVCETLEPLCLLAERIGANVLDPTEAEYAEVARLEKQKQELERKITEKRLKLGGS